MQKKILIIMIIGIIILVILNVYKTTYSKIHPYKEEINIPTTYYKRLQKKINKEIGKYQKSFKYNLKDNDIQSDIQYTLNINYNENAYRDIISYVFYIETYLGGAHPSHDLWTVNYNTRNDEFITIDTLIEKNPGILKMLSDYTRKELVNDPRITVTSMLYEGTKSIKENFQYFNYANTGLIIYFPRYQIAPYASGDIEVLVPYELLAID